jgi:general secretion pathway protein D
MSAKRLMGSLAIVSVVGLAACSAAQQVPAPNQGESVPTEQTAPSPNQPATSRNVPPPAGPQAPIQAQAPQPSPRQQILGQSQQPAARGPVPTPAPASPAPVQQNGAGTVPQPERRLLPSPTVARGGGMVSLNFNRADLVEIIHIIAQQLGLNYTIDPDVKGTVTINSAQPLSPDDLLPIFHQILRMNGAIAVKTGNLYRITTIKDGKALARPVGQTKEDSFALQIVPVRFFSVAEMKKVLTPFLQPGGELIENPRGNFLIIMDLPSNIQRLMEIADMIDVQVFAGTRMEIYQPKVASAEELAQEMTKVMQSFASSAPQPESFAAEFIALPRINQVLVISHSEAAWTYAKRWLDRIDIVAEGPGRRIFIYPVENGKATELADVLNQALGQPSPGGRQSSSQVLQNLHRSTTTSGTGQYGSQFGTQSGTRSPTTSSPFGSSGMSSGFAQAAIAAPGQVPAPTASTPPAPGVVPPRPATPAGQQQAKPEEQLRIVADPATNSLIIFGTVQEFQNIKAILKDLDQIARQVLLDVLIAEVHLSDSQSLGFEYEIFSKYNPTIFGQTFGSTGAIRSAIIPGGAASGNTQFPLGMSGVIGRSNAVQAFVNALQTDSRAKILSSPSVLATDNRPARIQIGSEVPIPTGSVSTPISTGSGIVGTTTSFASSTTVQYRNTGTIVTIIPQVNSQGLVNLQILAEVSKTGPNVTVGQDSFPSFDTRQAETTSVVQDGDTLAIGGIIADVKSRDRKGVPYLMDLPVIGRFFGTTSDSTDRVELIMLITPHVIRGRDDARQVTEDFKNSLGTIRNELERMAREKEKLLQSAPPPQPQPAAPAPSADQPPVSNPPAPVPPPSAAPAGPNASTAPTKKMSFGPNASPIAADEGELPFQPAGALRQAYEANATQENTSNPFAQNESPVTQLPLLALAVKAGGEHPDKVSVNGALPGSKPMPVWTVQVAAFAQKKDAEALATDLRALGYDAFTQEAEVDAKLWHRVRVGKRSNQKDALELQKTLKANNKFEQAFIIRQ